MVDSGKMPRDPIANPDHLSKYRKEGTITEGYLSETSAQVTFLKKATIKDHMTGRLVEYTAVESSQNKLSKDLLLLCSYN